MNWHYAFVLLQYKPKEIKIMKNPLKKSKSELESKDIAEIINAGPVAGMTIANFAGKKGSTGGIIGAGFSLLISGLLVAMEEDDVYKKPSKNYLSKF
jgi:hypothetical protein